MKEPVVTPIDALASLLQSPDGFGFEALKIGLHSERERLGDMAYLTTFWLSDLGYDGFTDSISLGGSYATGEEAIAEATQWVEKITNKYLSEARAKWVIEPDSGLSSTIPFGDGAKIFYQSSHGLAGGFYDHIYICARVLGPFQGTIVDRTLLACFSKAKEELRSYLLDVAAKRVS